MIGHRPRQSCRDRRAVERGHTIVELLFASALLSITVAAAFGVVVHMQGQAARTTDRFTAEGEAQTIADRIAKDLRTAVAPSSASAAFERATPTEAIFYASLDDPNGPTRLHAYTALQSGTNVYVFHEDATAPDPGGSPGNYTYTRNPSVTRLDGRYVDVSEPMFTYHDRDGNELDPATTLSTLAGRRSIDQVGINLRVRVRPGAPVVVVRTLVHIRSVDYAPET
jgi:type II secretory pathway pseudopilin PulG